MAPDAGQAEHPAYSILSQFESRQVGDLSYIRAAGAGKDQYLVGFTKALFFHGLLLSSLDYFLDLFHGGKLSGHLYGSIYHQGRSHEDPGTGDRFNVLDLEHFRLQTQFFDRLFDSLRELIALGSTHSQHFDFLHVLLLSTNSVYEICLCP
jgi:hypothetical protein